MVFRLGIGIDPEASDRHHARRALLRNPHVHRLGDRLRRDGSVRQARLDQGATVGTLLSVRFTLAATLFWLLLAAGGALRELRTLRRRDVIAGLLLGTCGYAAQAGCYFTALNRIDASLLALLLYTFPGIVAVGAVLLGRERFDRRRALALGLALGGIGLVVAGAGTGALEPVGTVLGLCAALVYSAYILISDTLVRRISAFLLTALVCTGAAVTLTAGSALLGELRPGALISEGWGWLACLAVVSTVAAISLFFAGLQRVGPTSAAILATVEPLVTVVLASIVFGETLGPLQIVGAALLLAAVPVLHVRGSRAWTWGRSESGAAATTASTP